MDLSPNSATDLTSPLGASLAPIFGDNVQDLLNAGALNVKPTGILVVNSIDDVALSGLTTLRDAINQANFDAGEDLIVFDRSLFPTAQTITLNLGELNITQNLDIIAPQDELTGTSLLTVSGNNTSRVFEINSGVKVNLDNLDIANGLVRESDGGGGIKNSGILTLNNSIVRNSSAVSTLISIPSQKPFALGGYGGGIANYGDLTVSNSIVSNNLADLGGGIYSSGGSNTVNVSNSSLIHNSANYGAGIYSTGASNTVNVSNSSLIENSTNSSNDIYNGGGGIYSTGGSNTVNVSNSSLIHNSANFGGGIFNTQENTVNISNSKLSGNVASNNGGGGIFNFIGDRVRVSNSTLSDNFASYVGGGIYNFAGTVEVSNSTLSGNSAGGIGGGIFNGDRAILDLSCAILDCQKNKRRCIYAWGKSGHQQII